MSKIDKFPVAFILGAGPNALGVIRSLFLQNVPSIVCVKNSHDISLRSCLPQKKLVVAHSKVGDESLLQSLFREASNESRAVLIPCSDPMVGFVARCQETLAQRFDFCIPDKRIANLLLDKTTEVTYVSSLGFPTPKTVCSLTESAAEICNRLGLPIIVKPRSSEFMTQFGRKNQIVETEGALEELLQNHHEMLDNLIAQEVIPGSDNQQWVCNCTFDRESELVGAFVFRRLGLSPAHRGVTSHAISQSNPDVLNLVEGLGRELKYVGPAMIEFKYDARDGLYKYLEINPRIGLCNFFDTRCGVNNVFSTYCIASGVPHNRTRSRQRDGVVFLDLFGDLFSRLDDQEPTSTILKTYLRNALRVHYGMYWYYRDPFPGIAHLKRQSHRIFRRLINAIQCRRPDSVAAP